MFSESLDGFWERSDGKKNEIIDGNIMWETSSTNPISIEGHTVKLKLGRITYMGIINGTFTEITWEDGDIWRKVIFFLRFTILSIKGDR